MTVKWIDVKEDLPLKKLLEIIASGMDVVLTEDKQPVARLVPVSHEIGARVPGLHLGKIWISPDFNASLPDTFWLGESPA
jgi:antitoxin (DNA-binding transcriptional repressor) of toxin-antitoxin stability system